MTSSSRTPSFILEKRSSDDTSSIEENDWRPEPHPAVRPLWLGLQPSHPESLKIRDEDDNQQYPGSWELALVIAGLCVAVFLLSVDRTIVTTALPYISNEFQAFSNFGWYGSAYLLTSSVFQPSFGRIYDGFHLKWTIFAALLIFEVGSVVCATAATSMVFIIGRAITGVGSAGMLAGAFIIVVHSVPLAKRPLYTAGIGIFYSLGSIAGPLLGGVFTSTVTWRWCFWINLPVGGFTAVTMMFFKPRKHSSKSNLSLKERLDRLDVFGSALLFGSAIMFFLTLNYADLGAQWDDPLIIGLLVGCGISALAFAVWQLYRGDKALLPPALLRNSTVPFACLNATFLYSTILIHAYYLSIWFQAIKSYTALQAGLCLLAYIVPSAICTFIAGIITTKTKQYAPPAWVGCGISAVGAGLLIQLKPDTLIGNCVGYSVVAGVGVGLAVQQVFTAVQTVLPADLAPLGSAMVAFLQTFGASVFVFVGNTILVEELKQARIPGVDVLKVVSTGVTTFMNSVPPSSQLALRQAYAGALRDVFVMGAVTAGLAFIASFGLGLNKSKRVTSQKPQSHERDASDAEMVLSADKL